MLCPNCGSQNDFIAKFCQNCGKDLRAAPYGISVKEKLRRLLEEVYYISPG
jgi:predicted amidophosphoribosyltransferase